MHVRGIVVGAALVGLLPGVVGAATAAPTAAVRTAAAVAGLPQPAGSVRVQAVDGELVRPVGVAEALAGAVRARDARDLLGVLARATAVAAPDAPRALVAAADEEEPALGGPAEELFAFSVPAGDLDGDGLDDALSYRSSSDGVALRALRGTDGALLWESAGGEAALGFPLARDLTGDGRDDLLVSSFTFDRTVLTERASTLGREERYEAAFRVGTGLVSGQDGALLWSEEVHGELVATFSEDGDPLGVAYRGEGSLRSTNLGVLTLVSEDLTGDGLPDLVQNEVDLDGDQTFAGAGLLVGASQGTAVTRSATRARVLEGHSGRTTASRALVDQSDVALLLPGGQLTGSPAADLLLTTGTSRDEDLTCADALLTVPCADRSTGAVTMTVEALDGASGASAWRSTRAGSGFGTEPVGADLDGDGIGDLFRTLLDASSGTLELLSGRDGRRLWEVTGEGFPPFLLEVEDSTAVLAAVEIGDRTLDVVLQRRDAADGTLRGTERVAGPRAETQAPAEGQIRFTFASLYLGGVTDGDGDGRGEAAVAAVAESVLFDEDFEELERDAASASTYLPLTGGAPLLDERTDDLRLVLPLADLDGDGLLEVARYRLLLEPDAVLVETTALRLRDGRELWRVPPGALDAGYPAGDQDGRPGQELLQDAPGGVVRSLHGADLGLRWQV